MEMSLKIPKERIGVVIGKKGKTKEKLESISGVKIDVDSKTGEVFIRGNNAEMVYKTQEVIKAIGRGFSPEKAILLYDDNTFLDIIDLKDYFHTKNAMRVKKGRVIGEKGKIREFIEKQTDTHLSVYGKTISIIGSPENVEVARHAVEAMLSGYSVGGMKRKLFRELTNKKEKEMLEDFLD